jgi:hypothetical protein
MEEGSICHAVEVKLVSIQIRVYDVRMAKAIHVETPVSSRGAQEAEHLPSKREALSSNPTPARK